MDSTQNSSNSFTRKRALLIGFCLIVLLALIFGWSLGRVTAPVAPQVAEPAVVAENSSSVAQTMPPVRPWSPPKTSGSPMSIAEQKAAQVDAFSTFETRLRTDTPDAQWSAPAEKNLVEAASEPALTKVGVPENYNAFCSGHMCKITLDFANKSQADDWSDFYPVGMGGTLSSVRTMVSPGANGKAQLIIYATRPGFEKLLADPTTTAPADPGPPRR